MSIEPLLDKNMEAAPVPQDPGFFDGQIDGGFPVPVDPPGTQAEAVPGEEVQVAGFGMGKVISAFDKAENLLDEARKKGEKFKRKAPEGTFDEAKEPEKLPFATEIDDANAAISDAVPDPLTGEIKREGTAASTVGTVPKTVKVKVQRHKVSEVSEEYQRFTNDTPFSALDDFNAYRLDTDQDVMAVIAAHSKVYANEISDEAGKRIQHEATRQMADLIGSSHGRLMKKVLGGKILEGKRPGEVAANMLAARDLLVWSAQKVDSLAKLLAENDNKAMLEAGFKSAEELAVTLQRSSALHAGIQAKVKGAQTEIARTLSAFNIPAEQNLVNQAIVDQMVQSNGGLDYMRTVASLHVQLASPEKRAKHVRLMNKTGLQKTWDAAYEVWINALLSNPVTHVVNILGNSGHLLGQVPVRGVAAAFARARRAKTGELDGVQGGEATAMVFAIKMAYQDAVRLAGAAFKNPEMGLAKVEPGRKFRQKAFSAEAFGMSGHAGQAFDLAGTLLTMGRGATKGLAMGDVFFKVLGQRMELYARAYRETALEYGDEAGSRMGEFAEALAHRIENPTAEATKASMDFGQLVTFTNDLGTIGKNMQGFSNNAFVRWFIPFLKTPTNILTRAWEFTPMNMLANNYREALLKGGHHADLARARVALGTATSASIIGMSEKGLITGGGPSDPQLRANLTRHGWQPYSFKIGDRYYSYKRVEPFATVFGLTADLWEVTGMIGEEDGQKLVAATILAFTKNVTNKTYMSGLSKIIDVLENPDKQGERALNAFIKSLSPRVIAQIEKQGDPTVRHVRGMIDAVRQDVPGWSKGLPAKIDLWGRPMVNEIGPYGTGMINPIYTSKAKPNPVDAEMDRLKFSIGPLSEKLPGVKSDYKLLPFEYYDYAKKAGQLAFIRAKELVTGSDGGTAYAEATDKGKEILLRSAIQGGRNEGLAWLMNDSVHADKLETMQIIVVEERVRELTR